VITTRLAVADIAEHEHASAPRRDLEQLSSDAGAKLLRALGVKGHEADLQILYRGRFFGNAQREHSKLAKIAWIARHNPHCIS
jgi:hypothetical protein